MRQELLLAVTGFFRGPNIDRSAIWAVFCGKGNPPRRLGLCDETRRKISVPHSMARPVFDNRRELLRENYFWHPHFDSSFRSRSAAAP